MRQDPVHPIALCLEYLDVRSRADRYMCCVAPPGYDAALGLDTTGVAVWRDDMRTACELWVSADNQLVLVRRARQPEVLVKRAGRTLSAPTDKPVVLLDGDRLEIGGRSLLVHIHGRAEQVLPPQPLEQERSTRPMAAIAAAVAISASTLGCDKPSTDPIEATSAAVVPDHTPPAGSADALPPASADPVEAPPDAAATEPAASAPASASSAAPPPPTTKKPPIEVRDRPPMPVRRNDDIR